MTNQSKGFTPLTRGFFHRHLAADELRGHLLASPLLLIVLSLFSACAAELEDPDEYTSRVRPGLGASGVRPARGVAPDDSDPGVDPDETTDVEPNPTGNVAPQSTSTSTSQSTDETSSVDTSTGVSAECADAPTRILQDKCDGSSCHGSPGMPTTGFSDIASSTDPMHLIDVPAKFTCSSKMLIDSESPADSAILSAVQADGHCSGGRMPSGGPYLSDDEIRCLTEWVNAVASGAI